MVQQNEVKRQKREGERRLERKVTRKVVKVTARNHKDRKYIEGLKRRRNRNENRKKLSKPKKIFTENAEENCVCFLALNEVIFIPKRLIFKRVLKNDDVKGLLKRISDKTTSNVDLL